MTDATFVDLKDVELMWVHHLSPDSMSGKFQLDIVKLTPEHIAALASVGIKPAENSSKPEKGKYITCKSTRGLLLVDIHGDEIKEPIGNGSIANCRVGPYHWEFKGRRGVSASLAKAKVTKMVTYQAEQPADDGDL